MNHMAHVNQPQDMTAAAMFFALGIFVLVGLFVFVYGRLCHNEGVVSQLREDVFALRGEVYDVHKWIASDEIPPPARPEDGDWLRDDPEDGWKKR